ncbi:hypothetical protein CYY_006441 [Polysphondylium violaceum]|uniref:Uncharacterized protein n=1 Tax=Polysphondylium violaceum TaxID=133409 RepID=A0A8J4URH7_9MYCE|nr:hypothetical protein CYY_006441 [Polysphondylium violaceum]
MIIDSYRLVFGNKFLASHIFNIVHQLQINKYPLKYNDIVDVGWMIKYGHVGLAKEKINDHSHLYVSHEDLFSIVANTDTKMFIYLFEKYKYYALQYIDNGRKSLKENQQVIEYLLNNGYVVYKKRTPCPSISSCSLDRDKAVESMVGITETDFIFTLESGFDMWSSCIDRSGAEFFKIWKAWSRRIRITPNTILFHLSRDIRDDDNDVDLYNDDDYVIDISRTITKAACVSSSLIILGFLIDKGLKAEVQYAIDEYEDFFGDRMAETPLSHEECHVVVKMVRSDVKWIQDVLLLCSFYGYAENFNSLYPSLKQLLLDPKKREQILFECVKYKNYHMIPVLASQGIFFSDYIDGDMLFDMCNHFSGAFSHLLEYIDRAITNTVAPEARLDTCTEFLKCAIDHDDFVGVKFIFNKYKFESLDENVIKTLSFLNNLAIIDYINKNRSLCFTETALNNNYMHTLFSNLFNQVLISPLNIPLIEYLVKENCINFKDFNCKLETQAFFNPDFSGYIQNTYHFHEFVYLIDHNNYSSIDPFIKLFINDTNWRKYLVYIYRNQHKFQMKPSFQSIFDHIVINLNQKNLQKSKIKLKALVRRYGCVLNDNHYQHLVQYTDGLTLFGIVPHSIFVSNNDQPPPQQYQNDTSSRPLKKKKE